MNHRDILNAELINVIKNLKFDKVLEIGSGDYSFRDDFNCLEYITSDKKSGGEKKFNVNNIPYGDESFDCVFMSHCFEHFLNPLKALKEIYRILKKEGMIINITPHHCEHQVLYGDSDHIFVLTEIQSRKLLDFVGFKDINVYTQKKINDKIITKEQDYNLFSIAKK